MEPGLVKPQELLPTVLRPLHKCSACPLIASISAEGDASHPFLIPKAFGLALAIRKKGLLAWVYG